MDEEKPGLAPDTKALVEKLTMWLAFGVFAWVVLLGVIAGTVVFVRWISQFI